MSGPLQLLTNSRARAFRACPRRHDIAYNRSIRPARDAEALHFGTLIHSALEHWWDGARRDGAPDLTECLAILEFEPDPYVRARGHVMLIAYHEAWAGDVERYEVLGVEVPFECDLVNPATGSPSKTFRLAGKLDALCRERSTGRVLIVEHKTSSEDLTPGSDYWARLRMDSQVSTYFAGARSLGYEPAACLYDVLGKPGQKPLLATPPEARKYTKPTKAEPVPRLYANQRESDETPDEYEARMLDAIAKDPSAYVQRAEVVRLDAEREEAAADVWHVARMIRDAQLEGRHPRNPDACHARGSTCAYYLHCTGAERLDGPGFRVLDDPHPELATKEIP